MNFETWLRNVRASLAAINMSLEEWQNLFPYDFKADFDAGVNPEEAAKRACNHYWDEQIKALPVDHPLKRGS